LFTDSLKLFPGFDGLRQAGIVELAGENVPGLTIGISVLKVNLQSPTKVLAHLSTFAISVRAIYQFAPFPPNSMLFIVMKSSLPAYNIVEGEGGTLL